MASSSDPIPRLAPTGPQQDGNGTDDNGAGASALPGTSNEAAAQHIGKGKGKGYALLPSSPYIGYTTHQ